MEIYICDDDTYFIGMINQLLAAIPAALDYLLHSYTDPERFLKDLEQTARIDILLMDIQFPGDSSANGYQIAEVFRKRFPDSVLLFCSGVYDITPDTLTYTPFRYIKKNSARDKILQTLQEAVDHAKDRRDEPELLAYRNMSVINLSLDDITYISRKRGVCNVYLTAEAGRRYGTDHLTAKQPLSHYAAELQSHHFVQPHNSYLVNLRYVWKADHNTLILRDETVLSIARSKADSFKRAVIEYSSRKYQSQFSSAGGSDIPGSMTTE